MLKFMLRTPSSSLFRSISPTFRVVGRLAGTKAISNVSVSLGGQTKKSRLVKKTVNPKWDENFEFTQIQESSLGALPLLIDVVSPRKGLTGKDVVVGSAKVDLLGLQQARHKLITTPLTVCGGGLKLEVTWVPLHVVLVK